MQHRVVVVGGGFGGLQAVRKLRGAAVEITLVDRRNFHLFQPLVYQVATGSLSAGEIASPLRAIFKRDRTSASLLGEVTGFDLAAPARSSSSGCRTATAARELPYDTLIVAGGSSYSYFGHDDWRPFAPDIKSLESALEVRRRILDRLRGGRGRAGPRAPRRLAHVRRRRRGPDGRRAGRADRRDRPRHAAPRLPLGRHAHGADPARRDGRPRPAALPARALGAAPRARSSSSASRR